ncbi:glycerophosphoryl diester phosphodiesterase [Bryobacterales bacterium F-183]|nr:glycerophosphoryl diester phosphodiesterase [Bryobacterales bacterium F-183]
MFADTKPIEVHGHRGARMVLPENTLPGFEYAAQQGADYFEIDTWVTKDDVVVVAHDAAMNLKHCKGPSADAERTIRNMTLAELRKWDCGVANPDWPKQKGIAGTPAPTLDEVFGLLKKYPKVKINLEIKSNPKRPELQPAPAVYARMIVDAIRKHKAGGRVLVQSFDFAPLIEVGKLDPKLPLSALYPSGGADKEKNFVAVAKEAGNTGAVSVHFSIVTAEKVKQAHDSKIRVLAWTANSATEWDALLAAGVDGIITDDPAGLLSYLKEKKRR